MDWGQALAAGITGAAVIIAAAISLRQADRGDLAAGVRQLQAILADLDADSEQRTALVSHIDRQIEKLVSEVQPSRSWGDIVGGFVVALFMAVLLSWTLALGGWWLLLSPLPGVLMLAGVYGLIQGVPKVPRGEKGVRLDR